MRFTPLVIGLFALYFTLALVGAPPGDGDQFWQRWLGERVLSEHHLPAALGPETFAASGAPWVTQEWAFGIFLAFAYAHGWYGVACVLMGLVPALTLVLTALRIERRGASDLATALLVGMVGAACLSMFGMRAQFLGWPLLAGLLLAVESEGPWIWLAVPITALWANLHASAIIAPAVLLIETLGAIVERPIVLRQARRAFTVFGACAVAVCATPLGIRLPEYALSLATSPIRKYITEWQPPTLDAIPFAAGTLLIVAIAAILGFERGPRAVRNALLFIAFFWLALSAIRNETQFVIVCVPFIAGAVSRALKEMIPAPSSTQATPLDRAMRIILPVVCAIAITVGLRNNARARQPGEAAMPYAQAVALGKLPGPHRVFCEQAQWCSLFTTMPEIATFMDARFDPFPLELWRTADVISTLKPGWDDALRSLHVDAIITTSDSPLIDALKLRGGWRVAVRDKYHWLLIADRN